MQINKPFLYTLLIAILLFCSNIFFINKWWTKPCDCTGKAVIEWRDSTAPNKEPEKTIINTKPKLVGVKKYIKSGTSGALKVSNSTKLIQTPKHLSQVVCK